MPRGEVQKVSPLHFSSQPRPETGFPQVRELHPPRTTRYPAKLGSGFWSVTVYGLDGFFVPSQLDRFSISGRTPGLRRHADGTVTLVLGSEQPADPAHWLPTPAGLVMRAYEGLPDVECARWFPPPLEAAE